jgi:hypothetical protein
MSTFLDIALRSAARGWHVFPCLPAKKKPLIDGGEQWANASGEESQIRAWWTKWPDANVAIAGNGSGLAVLDVDHGLADEAAWRAWRDRNGIPETYAVRTGRRPEFGVQMYFAGRMNDVGAFDLDGCTGQVKSAGGYVMAAGCIHPDSGEKYEVICDAPVAPLPDVVRQLRKPVAEKTNNAKVPKTRWDLPVHEGEDRTAFLLEQTGAMRNLGCGKDSILAHMNELNDDPEIIADPVDASRLESTAANCAKFTIPELPPVVTIGKQTGPSEPVDWRDRYHTFEEMSNAPKPTFLIDGFLQKDVITAIAAPVGQRKTIVACNAVHAVLTGEPLFGHFAVTQRAERVLYLCPEMGLLSFADRMRNLGLIQYVGKSLFCRTMNSEGHLTLKDLTAEELTGAVVVVDTAVRFVEGDENSSEDMKVFAASCFGLMKSGAASVIVLFHSPKGTKEASELTLENAMRGSGDLGAFVSSCWATRLQDPDNDEWQSPSYMKNVKQRDFKSKPFEVTSDALGRLHIVNPPSANVTLTGKKTGTPANVDGKEEEALQVIRDNPELSQAKIMLKLSAMGIKRSKSWIGNKRFEVLNVGVQTSG